MSPERGTEWPVTNDAFVAVLPYAVVVPKRTFEFESSFVVHVTVADVRPGFATTVEITGAVLSLCPGVVLPVTLPQMPGGSVWQVGTIGRTPPCFFNHPGAMRCPGGTMAQSLFPWPWFPDAPVDVALEKAIGLS